MQRILGENMARDCGEPADKKQRVEGHQEATQRKRKKGKVKQKTAFGNDKIYT